MRRITCADNRKEVRAVVPRHALDVNQPEVGLVDQRRRLQAVSSVLPSRVSPRNVVEFPLYERNQLLQSFLVALTPPEQQPGDLRRLVRDDQNSSLTDAASSGAPIPLLKQGEDGNEIRDASRDRRSLAHPVTCGL